MPARAENRHRRQARAAAVAALAALAGCSGGTPAPPAAEDTPWRDAAAEMGLRFTHRTGAARELNIVQATGSGCAFLDFDDDGWLDVLLVQGDPASGGSRLFRSLEGRRFEDVTDRAGIRTRGYGMGCAVGDYDGDGRVDLYFCSYGTNQLYRNEGNGRFRDVTAAAGVGAGGWSVSAAFFDADGDGDQDLYVTRYARFTPADRQLCTANGIPTSCPPRTYRADRDLFYRNLGNGRFREAAAEAGFHDADGRGLGVAPADFDRDGDLDLFVSNDGTADYLWVNDGAGRFRERAIEMDCAFDPRGKATASMGIAWGDADGDGREDLVVGNFQNEPSSLFLNTGSRLEYASPGAGLAEPTIPSLTFGLGWLDWDNDGDLDLLQVNGHVQDRIAEIDSGCTFTQPRQLFENDGRGRFAEITAACGAEFARPAVGRGLALGDFDNDGRVDALVNNLGGAAALLRNRGRAGNWLLLDLRTGRGRRAGPVAVRCEAGGAVQRRVSGADGGFAGGRDPRLHLGLGDADSCSLAITWPGGGETRLARVRAGQVLRVEQPRP